MCPRNRTSQPQRRNDGGACIIEFTSGALTYTCRHASCAGKGWEDAKRALGLTSRQGAGSGDEPAES